MGAGSSKAFGTPGTYCSSTMTRRHAMEAFLLGRADRNLQSEDGGYSGWLPDDIIVIVLSYMPVLFCVPEYSALATGSCAAPITIGSGVSGGEGPDEFSYPKQVDGSSMIQFHPDGSLWAVDRGNGRVHHRDVSGELIKMIGTKQSHHRGLAAPVGADGAPDRSFWPISLCLAPMANKIFVRLAPFPTITMIWYLSQCL